MTKVKDVRPYLGTRVELARYYKRKADDELILSKLPFYEINLNGSDTCREFFISSMDSRIYEAYKNNVVSSNPYVLIPKAVIDIDNKKRALSGDIKLYSCGVNQEVSMTRGHKNIVKTLDYILGIISVCLSRGKDEKERRKLGEGKAGDYDFSSYTSTERWKDSQIINYKTLSPFWITSPILVSFTMGTARNCMAIATSLSKKDINNMLFSKISYEDVKKTINNTDYKTAQNIYHDVIEPFLSHKDIRNSSGIYISFEEKRKVLNKLIDDGFDSVFKPHRLKQHWNRFSEYYGFNRFCSYINSSKSVLGYENYTRT